MTIIAERCWASYAVELGTVDTAAMGNNLDGNLATVTAGDVFDSLENYSQYWFSGDWPEDSLRMLSLQWRVRAQGHGTLSIRDRASHAADGGFLTGWKLAGSIVVDSDELIDYHIDASSDLMTPAVFDWYGVDGQISCTSGTVQIDTAAALIIFSTAGETRYSGDLPGSWAEHGPVTTTSVLASGIRFGGDNGAQATATSSSKPSNADLTALLTAAAGGTGWVAPDPSWTASSGSTFSARGRASVGYSTSGLMWYSNGSVVANDAFMSVADPDGAFGGLANYADDLAWGVDWIYDPNYFVYEDAGAGEAEAPATSTPIVIDVDAYYDNWNPAGGASDDTWSIGFDPTESSVTSQFLGSSAWKYTVDPVPGFTGNKTGSIVLSGGPDATPISGDLTASGIWTLPATPGNYIVYARPTMMLGAGAVTGVSGGGGFTGANDNLTAQFTVRRSTITSGTFRYWKPAEQTVTPPLRKIQRSDGLAMGANRRIQTSTIQSSNRKFGIV